MCVALSVAMLGVIKCISIDVSLGLLIKTLRPANLPVTPS